MDHQIDVMKVREYRAKLREIFPELQDLHKNLHISHETLSAALAFMSEVLTRRIMNSVSFSSPEEVVKVMEHISTEVSGSMKKCLLKYLPEGLVFSAFIAPKEPPPKGPSPN